MPELCDEIGALSLMLRDGELAEHELLAIELHLIGCDACRTHVERDHGVSFKEIADALDQPIGQVMGNTFLAAFRRKNPPDRMYPRRRDRQAVPEGSTAGGLSDEVQASPPAVGSIRLDVLLGFPYAATPWWSDGKAAPALFETLRAHGLWLGFDHAGLAGDPLEPLSADGLGPWSAGWVGRGCYRVAGAGGGPTRLELSPTHQGVRLLCAISAEDVAPRAARLLDDVVGWLRALRRSDVAGGVRVRRAGVIPDADYTPPAPPPYARAWDLGTVLDAVDRDAYAGEVAAQYFAERYASIDEGEAELARLLAAPAPPGSVRVDDGPLVLWKHVADLTGPAAVASARAAQQLWITGLVEVEPVQPF